ncbi:MAG: hypothetical protein IKN98_07320, partial [Bacteroidales bacterium]|nr:hypothetical protein [Bacteroidales bacterium]
MLLCADSEKKRVGIPPPLRERRNGALTQKKDVEIPPPLHERRNGALTQKKKLRGWMGAAQ